MRPGSVIHTAVELDKSSIIKDSVGIITEVDTLLNKNKLNRFFWIRDKILHSEKNNKQKTSSTLTYVYCFTLQ